MQIRNLKYNSQNTVDCEIEHPIYGWIPFTASPDDPEEHGRQIYQEAITGQHGEISPYVPPVIDEVAILEAWRNRTEVSRFQAMAALHYAGHLDAIQSYMDTQADVVQKLAWNTAQVFKRMSTTVLALQPLLELSDEQLDDLFKFALTIEA